MSETHEIPNDDHTGSSPAPVASVPGPTSQDAPNIFDERFQMFMDGFGETCEANQVQLALAVVVDPNNPQPLVFLRGDSYSLAKLSHWLLGRLREQIMSELK